jgi:hypothetical protein
LAISNGKVYGSKAAAYQVLVRPQKDSWNHDGSVLLDTRPALTAEFAFHGGEFTFDNPLTGNKDVGADIRGHFFDSAQQAAEKGWSQEEHDVVVNALDRLCVSTPEYVWEVTMSKVAAPWPTYDKAHHNQIPVLAEQLGLVAEALAYEQQEQNRPSVVAKLSELVNALQASEGAEEALTAA